MEDFEFDRRVPLEDVKQLCPQGEDQDEFIKPYNYVELFKPESAAELRKFIGAATPVGAEDTPASSSAVSNKKTEPKSLKDLI